MFLIRHTHLYYVVDTRPVCQPLKSSRLIASRGKQVKGVDWACLCKIRLGGGGGGEPEQGEGIKLDTRIIFGDRLPCVGPEGVWCLSVRGGG